MNTNRKCYGQCFLQNRGYYKKTECNENCDNINIISILNYI